METKPFFVFKAYVVKEYITITNDREKKIYSMLVIRDNRKLTLNVNNKFESNLNKIISETFILHIKDLTKMKSWL